MCLAHPRLVEAALSLRYAREAEGQLLSETWHNIRVLIAVDPRGTLPARLDLIQSAFPELFAKPSSSLDASLPFCIVDSGTPISSFVRELGAATCHDAEKSIAESCDAAVLLAPPRIPKFTRGRCACGRPSLHLSRCAGCIRADAELELDTSLPPVSNDVCAFETQPDR